MSEASNQTGKLLALEVLLRQANERAGNMAVELAAMTQERDALRRENDMVVDILIKAHPCIIWERNPTPTCRGEDISPNMCRMCVRDWAKQQAAKAGKGER